MEESGLCIEYQFNGARDGETHTIYRPRNIDELQRYLHIDFIESVREDHGALSCKVSNIYIRGESESEQMFEFRIGNLNDYDIECHFFDKKTFKK